MRNRRVIILFFIFLAVPVLIFIFRLIRNVNEVTDKQISIHNKAELLLNNAQKLAVTSSAKAWEMCSEALSKARKTQNYRLLADCQITMGRILSIQGKNKESLGYLQQALKTSDFADYPYGICNAYMETGRINYIWGNYEDALHYFTNALKLAQIHKFLKVEAFAYDYIGKYYHTTGNFDKSIEFYEKSIVLYHEMEDTVESAAVLLSIGKTYVNEGNMHMALRYYLDAYRTGEKTDDYLSFASICNHLGTIYLALGQPDKSLEYHMKALSFRKKLGNPEGLAKSYNNIGETYLVLGQTDSAEINFKKSIEYCMHTGYKKGTVKALTNLGIVNKKKGNLSEARRYLTKSLNIAKEAGYDAGMAESSLAIGNTLLSEKEYDKAIASFCLSLTKAKSSNMIEFFRDIYYGLYQCYLGKNDVSRALHYHVLLSDADMKMLKAENNRQLAELRVTFDSEKKEKDNQVLRKENELKEMTIQRKSALMWLFIAILAITFLLCILIYTRFTNKKKANEKLEILNKKILDQNRKLEKLNNEMDQANREKDKILSVIAHELRNPLYWFQNLAEVLSKRYRSMPPGKVQKSLSALDESAKNAFHLMDNLLQWSRSRLNRITPKYGLHSLDTLIDECTRMYETILRQKEINLTASVPAGAKANIDPDLFSVVVRNLVSNAIKYTPVKGMIDIGCSEKGNEYVIDISDSGVGISDDNMNVLFDPGYHVSSQGLLQEKGSGFGLKLCKEFVELNHGTINVTSETGRGTRFVFTVPKN